MINFRSFWRALAFSTFAYSAAAQPTTDIQAQQPVSAYAQDGRNVIMRNAYGLCWRSGSWTSEDAVTGCDGDLAPPIVNPTAPPLVQPIEIAPLPHSLPTTKSTKTR